MGQRAEPPVLGGVRCRPLDTWHFGPQYVLFGGQWVNAGTFRADIAETVWGYTWGYVFGHNQGTFTMLGSPIGDVYGTFYWDWSNMTNSIATGTAVKRCRTVPVQMTLLLEDPSGLPTPPYSPCNTGYGSCRNVRVTVPNSATPAPPDSTPTTPVTTTSPRS
ncbi:MAG: hypothetical protein WCF04_00725 [Candidatus Nanopelagicales bacterium]